MAPQNQRNATANLSRAVGAASVGGSSANKKATKSLANASAKSSTSTPVAPLTISKLNDLENEETAFPRGGGSVLTPLEYKQVTDQAARDVLFETETDGISKGADVDSEGGEDHKPKKKRRKVEHSMTKRKAESRPAEDKGPRVEGLSFKVSVTCCYGCKVGANTAQRIISGMVVLGCVAQINTTDITVSLPNNLSGYVSIISISEQLTRRLLEEDQSVKGEDETGDIEPSGINNEDFTDLSKYFRIGQYIRVYVRSVEEKFSERFGKHGPSFGDQTAHGKRIELSVEPLWANYGITVKELVPGCAIQASVTSVEDHGLILSLGLENKSITGFMPTKELDSHWSLSDIHEGQIFLCLIKGMASNGKVVKLSGIIDKSIGTNKGKAGPWLNEAPTIDAFTPGTGVQMLVTDVGSNGGLRGKLMGMLDGVVDLFHAQGWNQDGLEDRVKVGSKVNARVLFTNPNSDPKKLNLTILPHILSLGHPVEELKRDPTSVLPIATIIEEAIVTQVVSKVGLFLNVGIPSVPGFVHISRISDKKIDDLSTTTGNYKVGSVHRARITGYNAIDGLFICSMEQRVLDQKYLRAQDIKVGEVVKGKIQKILAHGSLLVELSDGITAYVDENHLSDVRLKNPEKKFREGMMVTGRVLVNDPVGRQLRITIKKTLVYSEAPIITSYENATPGMQTPGTLISVLPTGAVVQFYSGVTAFLHVSEMSEALIQDPREHFHIGQSVTINVLTVDVENEKMRVSCKDPKAFGEIQRKALQDLQVGQIVSGTVTENSATDLVLALQDVGADGLKGTVLLMHLVDGSPKKASRASRNIRVGQTLKDVLVVGKLENKRLVMLSMKPSLVSAAKEGRLVKGVGDVKEGDVLSGYITNITMHNAFVTFPGGGVGAIPKSGMPLERVSSPDFGLLRNQSITATVCVVDHAKDRFYLTLNKYEDPKPVNRLPSGDKLKSLEERAKSVAIDHALDSSLKSMNDIVPGKITKAKIISVKGTQLNAQLAENIQGRIDVSQIFDSWTDIKNKKNPLQNFKKNQVLDVKIIGIHDARNHRFLPITHKRSNTHTLFELSAKRDLKENSEVLTLDKIEVGSSWVAFVNNHGEDCVWVTLSPGIRGRIKILELSDDAGVLKDLSKNFPIGCAVRCHVTYVDPVKNQLYLSARTSSLDKAITYDFLEKGMILPARVTRVTNNSVIVQLSEHISAPIGLTDLTDDFSFASPSKFTKNDIIRVYVLDVDKTYKRVALSTRPSRVLSSSSKVKDPEILTLADVNIGDVRRGFVKQISEKGVFVHLGGTVTAFVKITNISDIFIKDWKTAVKVDQMVRGRVIQIEKAVDHVQMSLKQSAVDGKALPQIQWNEVQVGQVVKGTIRSVAEYGVFIVVDGSSNVSGLCHNSKVSDTTVKDIQQLYSPGDQVKAKVLEIDLEKRRLSFGLKASYFEDMEDEEMADSEGDNSDGGVDLAMATDFDESEETKIGNGPEPDAVMLDAPTLITSGPGLSTNGFDWTGGIFDTHHSTADACDTSDSGSGAHHADRKRRRKSIAAKIQHDMTGDLDTRTPESVSDFERLLMGNPQSGELWVRYMAFELQLSEVDKAKEIAKRALKMISSMTKEGLKEKEIIWAAMLNLELEYGTEESLEEVFKSACMYNDSLEMHEKLCNIYIQAGKHEVCISHPIHLSHHTHLF